MEKPRRLEIDGNRYIVLQYEKSALLLEKEGELTEYIVLTGITETEDDVCWRQARYYSNYPAAKAAWESLGMEPEKDMKRELAIAKNIAANVPLDVLKRRYGRLALLKTIAALINGRNYLPPIVRQWALTVTGDALDIGNLISNAELIEVWKDAKKQRLFYFQNEGEQK